MAGLRVVVANTRKSQPLRSRNPCRDCRDSADQQVEAEKPGEHPIGYWESVPGRHQTDGLFAIQRPTMAAWWKRPAAQSGLSALLAPLSRLQGPHTISVRFRPKAAPLSRLLTFGRRRAPCSAAGSGAAGFA